MRVAPLSVLLFFFSLISAFSPRLGGAAVALQWVDAVNSKAGQSTSQLILQMQVCGELQSLAHWRRPPACTLPRLGASRSPVAPVELASCHSDDSHQVNEKLRWRDLQRS